MMFSEPVVYIDIETSGGSYTNSKTIEVGAIRVENGVVTAQLSTLINPGGYIPQFITNLTGIHQQDVAGAPSFEQIAPELYTILDGAIFIAHNVTFDYSFIKKELSAAGYDFGPKLLCTVRLSRALYPEHKGHSLEKIIARHNITVKNRHRALDDAMAIKEFAEIAFQQKGAESFVAAVAKQHKRRHVPANLAEPIIDSLPRTSGVYVFEDEAGAPIYVGKSVNVRSRVMSHFSQAKDSSKELKMASQTHNVRVIETKSEIEALLLESDMVKDLLPIHNRRLRRQTNHYALLAGKDNNGYLCLRVESVELATIPDMSQVYGVFSSKRQAIALLQSNQKTFSLCPKLLGLEKSNGACFAYQLKKCAGACIGIEEAAVHNRRNDEAFSHSKLHRWPFKTPVAISQNDSEYIVVDDWKILGYISQIEHGSPYFKRSERLFSIDTYRILRTFLSSKLKGAVVMPVTELALQQMNG